MYRQLSPTELQQLQLYVNQAYQSSDSKDHKQEVELRLIPHRGWTTGKYNPDGERHARTRQGKVSGYNRYGQSQRGQQDHGTANRPQKGKMDQVYKPKSCYNCGKNHNRNEDCPAYGKHEPLCHCMQIQTSPKQKPRISAETKALKTTKQ